MCVCVCRYKDNPFTVGDSFGSRWDSDGGTASFSASWALDKEEPKEEVTISKHPAHRREVHAYLTFSVHVIWFCPGLESVGRLSCIPGHKFVMTFVILFSFLLFYFSLYIIFWATRLLTGGGWSQLLTGMGRDCWRGGGGRVAIVDGGHVWKQNPGRFRNSARTFFLGLKKRTCPGKRGRLVTLAYLPWWKSEPNFENRLTAIRVSVALHTSSGIIDTIG